MLHTWKKFINENPHCLLLCYWILYIICFMLLEKLVVAKYIIYSPIDDMIPFEPLFIIPYALWFPMLAIPQAYYLFTNRKEEFQNLCFFMFVGMSISLILYVIFPNGVQLRVDSYPNTICGNIVQALQGFDTPTNVCPSIHVASALAICMAVVRSTFKHNKQIKLCTLILTILIILSTMFLKQHSIIDVIAGIILTLILYPITYYTNWRKLFKKTLLNRYVE